MNKAESSYISLHLLQNGMYEADTPETADTVIIHTCSVRQTAENRIWGRLGWYSAQKKERNFRLIVVGCMADRLKEKIHDKVPAVDYVFGNIEKMDLFQRISGDVDMKTGYRFPLSYGYEGSAQAYVPIIHGCNNFCSYCIVPYVRGREISRPAEKILYECKVLEESNVREITLLGQNVNSYRGTYKGSKIDFPQLLRLVIEQNSRVPWFRFLTSHPKDFSPELIECIKEYPNLCREIHLPVQHGSNKILQSMQRRYSREKYLALVDAVRKAVPDIALTTDLLIGFPGEDEQDFSDTVHLLKQVQFDDAFTYKYNTREGTPAVDLPGQVPEEIKQKRLEEIIAIQRDISNNRRMRRIGSNVDVLGRQLSKKNGEELLGVTEYGSSVVFSGCSADIGTIVRLKLTDAYGSTFKGEKI